MKTIGYQLIPENAQIHLGMVVLQSDVTIEDEFRRYFADTDLSLLVSRIPFEDEVTEKTCNLPRYFLLPTLLTPSVMPAHRAPCRSGATASDS